MRKLRALWTRLRGLPRGQQADDDFAAELESHVAMHTEDGIRAGLTPAEARRRALIKLGGAEQTRQAYRERRTLPWLENLVRDVRYALHGFRRNPAFAITAIVTLALGIGATTAVFSVVDQILFRSLPYAHDDRLVSVGMVQSLEEQEFTLGGFFYEWRDRQTSFEAMASQGAMMHPCDLVENNPAQLNCITAQAGFLPLLGVSPALGRNFLPEEDRPGGPRVALISYGLWLDHYNRDSDILNRLIDVDGSLARVVGVLPRQFQLPSLQIPDVIFPMALNESLERQGQPGSPMRTYARLKPGSSVGQAVAEMEPIFIHTSDTFLAAEYRKDFHLSIRSLRDVETKDARLSAWILFSAVLVMLLVAFGNVASLMIARGAAREHEFAMRTALGASRLRLVRQSLTEAGVLTMAGTVVGLGLAEGLLRTFVKIAPLGMPFLNRAALDLRTTVFVVGLSVLGGLFFGLFPALQTPRHSVLSMRPTRSLKRANLRRLLVVVQIAGTLVLLSSAGLLLRSFQNMVQQSLGMETRSALIAQIAVPAFRYNTSEKKADFYLRLESAVRRLPGVLAVSFTDSLPPGGWNSGFRLSDLGVSGKPPAEPGTGGSVTTRLVTPDYFRAMNIPIVHGRNFAEADRNSGVNEVILSRLLAARLFPGEDPVGKMVQAGHNVPWSSVVGVAENVKNNGLIEQSNPEIYVLRTDKAWGPRAPIMIVGAAEAPEAVAPWVRAQLAAIDATVPVTFETLRASVSKLAERARFEAALLSSFALCGLLMAVIGVYGVIAYVAAQRTQEIGVRMALGATRMDILRLIAGEGVRLIAVGGIVGLGAAFAAVRLLKSLLFEVSTHDPGSFIAVTVLLGLVASVATLIPARTAMKTDPMQALRTE